MDTDCWKIWRWNVNISILYYKLSNTRREGLLFFKKHFGRWRSVTYWKILLIEDQPHFYGKTCFGFCFETVSIKTEAFIPIFMGGSSIILEKGLLILLERVRYIISNQIQMTSFQTRPHNLNFVNQERQSCHHCYT